MAFLPAAGLVMILVGVGSYYATRSLHGMSALLDGEHCARRRAGADRRGRPGAPLPRLLGCRVAARRAALRRRSLWRAFALVIALDVWARSLTARLDLTVDRIYTLSDQTRALCAELDAKNGRRSSSCSSRTRCSRKDVKLLVAAYADACPAVEVRDASRTRAARGARELYTTSATTVIACRGDVCDPVGYPSERNITSAILRLARERVARVYFRSATARSTSRAKPTPATRVSPALLRDQGFERARAGRPGDRASCPPTPTW